MQQPATPADRYARNFSCLEKQYPQLAQRLAALPGRGQIRTGIAKDGGLYYAVERDGQWIPVTDPATPLARIQHILDESATHLRNYTRPVFLLGLYPGHELVTVFRACEQETTPHCPQPLWVCLDSTIALEGLMHAVDLVPILTSPRVRFFWYEDADTQVKWLRENPDFPHLFTLISAAPAATLDKVMPPFAALIQEREQLTAQLKSENARHYDAISDQELADILRGKGGRPPRLLMPTCAWSTFIQYSTRDTCAAFRARGWEVRELNMQAMLTPFYLVQTIHEFKPDLFLFIDHMRYEAEDLYPRGMLFVTWIQDEMDHLFCRTAGESLARYAQQGRRDLVVGYARQNLCAQYGYPQDRVVTLPVMADTRIFHPVTLSAADQQRYGCELAFMTNAGMPTEQIVEERIIPHVEALGISRSTVENIHDRLWSVYRAGQTLCHRGLFLETLFAYEEFRRAYDTLRTAGEEERLLRLFYWKLNDAIYRHVVIEWAAAAGVDVHLYGHGWNRHPRFGKFARGNVEHGPELNKAYRGARWNLHLNITQGMHQRVWELIGAGASPLFRAREPAPGLEPSVPVMRRWAEYFMSGQTGPFPDDAEKDEITGEWLFHKATALASEHPDAAPPELEEKLTEQIYTLVMSRPDVIVTDWDQRTFHDQKTLLQRIRSRPESASCI